MTNVTFFASLSFRIQLLSEGQRVISLKDQLFIKVTRLLHL